LSLVNAKEQYTINHQKICAQGRPLIGVNLRQWFHFSSGILPYKFARYRYLARSQEKMSNVIEAVAELISALRRRTNARIVLISTYEPNVESWEDDLPWLQQVKARFGDDDQVAVANQPFSLMGYCLLLSKLDLMIGVRLHSALTAIRFGVPALNLSYTLKGQDIFHQLGFGDRVVDLESFICSPAELVDKAVHVLGDPNARDSTSQVTEATIRANEHALDELLALCSRRSHQSI
jgi:polysaccharide pyruvyl transferase WcaK-like protein